jgi:hypothetical protein
MTEVMTDLADGPGMGKTRLVPALPGRTLYLCNRLTCRATTRGLQSILRDEKVCEFLKVPDLKKHSLVTCSVAVVPYTLLIKAKRLGHCILRVLRAFL